MRFQIDELAMNELAYVQFSVALVTQEGEMGMNEPPPQAPNPAEVYESFLVPHLFTPWARDLVARAGLKIGERVLDVACGTGIVVREVLPTVGPNGRVVGVDFSPAMLEVAQTRVPSEAPVEWYEASAEALPFPGAAFDLVLCQQGLQFFPDKPGAIREFSRVLAPGGRVALSVWRTLEHNPVHEAMNEAVVRHLGTPTLAASFSGNAPELEALLSGTNRLRRHHHRAGDHDAALPLGRSLRPVVGPRRGRGLPRNGRARRGGAGNPRGRHTARRRCDVTALH